MAITTTKSDKRYTPERLEKTKEIIKIRLSQEPSLKYEIKIDDMTVVPKTSDISQFESMHLHLDDDSEKLSVCVYIGKSNHCDKFNFYMQAESDQEAKALGENSPLAPGKVKANISTEYELQKRDIADLQKKLAEHEEKLLQADEYISTLESEVEKTKVKKNHFGEINLGEVSSLALEGLIRRNTHLLAKIPGAEGLAGMIEKDNRNKITEPIQDANVSFTREDDTDKENELSGQAKIFADFMQDMKDVYGQEIIDDLVFILNHVRDYPDKIKTIRSML